MSKIINFIKNLFKRKPDEIVIVEYPRIHYRYEYHFFEKQKKFDSYLTNTERKEMFSHTVYTNMDRKAFYAFIDVKLTDSRIGIGVCETRIITRK